MYEVLSGLKRNDVETIRFLLLGNVQIRKHNNEQQNQHRVGAEFLQQHRCDKQFTPVALLIMSGESEGVSSSSRLYPPQHTLLSAWQGPCSPL